MTRSKSILAALASILVVALAAPQSVPEAEAASQQQTAKKKAKKKPAVASQQKKTNFRAARPDEYGRVFACDDWSLSVQPFCTDGHVPQFNVGGYRRGGMGRGGMR